MSYLNDLGSRVLNTRTSAADPYIVSGTNQQGNTAYYAVYTGTTQQFLSTALSTTNAIVIVEGHSNCGIGPAFPSDNIQHIQDFFNMGDSYTGVWLEDLKDTYPNLTVSVTQNQLPTSGTVTSMLVASASSEIANTGTNYFVDGLTSVLKYTNDDGVGNRQTFFLDYEWEVFQEVNTQWPYHYFYTLPMPDGTIRSQPFTIVKAVAADLRDPCYKAFFYDGCATGHDYIGNFQHGVFFYTTDYGHDDDSTKEFVKGVINGESWDQISTDINADAGTPIGGNYPAYFKYHQQSNQ
jgi:hypothetical protein